MQEVRNGRASGTTSTIHTKSASDTRDWNCTCFTDAENIPDSADALRTIDSTENHYPTTLASTPVACPAPMNAATWITVGGMPITEQSPGKAQREWYEATTHIAGTDSTQNPYSQYAIHQASYRSLVHACMVCYEFGTRVYTSHQLDDLMRTGRMTMPTALARVWCALCGL